MKLLTQAIKKQLVEEDLGIDFIIKTKHNADMELSEEEIDYLVRKLD